MKGGVEGVGVEGGGGIETEGIYEIIVGWCQVLPPIYSI